MLIYTEEIENPTTMRSSSGTFLPGSFGPCLERRNQFIFIGKTQEQEKKFLHSKQGLDRQQGSFFRGTLVDDLLPVFLYLFSVYLK